MAPQPPAKPQRKYYSSSERKKEASEGNHAITFREAATIRIAIFLIKNYNKLSLKKYTNHMKRILQDPLAEEQHSVLPQLIHKYENRVLCLLTKHCEAACPFCFRQDLYEMGEQENTIDCQKILDYVRKNPSIKEFIFSGGEPLLDPQHLVFLAKELVKIPHLKILRIHSRLPIQNYQAIPWEALEEIAKSIDLPIYFVLHTNHANELKSQLTQKNIARLRKLGFILLSHTVFLRGINDNLPALQTLMETLVNLGVKPYYIFHCDSMAHTQKWIVDLSKERALMSELRKNVSGLAYPLHVIDSSTGQGKIPVPTAFWDAELKNYRDFQGNQIEIMDDKEV